uniref:Protein HGH1 homolog n=1 Tax=Nelumbo nucifera TaxID=4432 RepID=A0A822YIJ2_NELNU|nr:TPA_asm: hypothetical protein HUJ06_009960 [Nelumbo nucifera]
MPRKLEPQMKKTFRTISKDDVMLSLSCYLEILLPPLSCLLGEKKDVSELATEALINLSQISELSAKMVTIRDCSIAQLLIVILINLTQSDAGIASLLQTGDDKIQGSYVMKLVRSFCSSSSEMREDPFEHVASILVNISVANRTQKMPLKLGVHVDPELKVQALEAIYLIDLHEAGRRNLWPVNGLRILQVGYEDEEDTKVMEAYEQKVSPWFLLFSPPIDFSTVEIETCNEMNQNSTG